MLGRAVPKRDAAIPHVTIQGVERTGALHHSHHSGPVRQPPLPHIVSRVLWDKIVTALKRHGVEWLPEAKEHSVSLRVLDDFPTGSFMTNRSRRMYVLD
jgi:hypothetical protein